MGARGSVVKMVVVKKKKEKGDKNVLGLTDTTVP